ncbi:hypothetical protein COLO4_37452 [Corchorus olitorius]|uniref:Pentacotripeptide-repeat region of PRORP domain-containing protein n=1 Tax=Corchorus olitorius TaxID=93759 RepID=A0A1R3G1I3_9ROSI|nr:hypothetical protein COLO4_37452 [Corchorus olitorius]
MLFGLKFLPVPCCVFFRDRRISIGASYGASSNIKISSNCIQENAVILESSQTISDKRPSLLGFYHSRHASSNFTVGRRSLSSQAGAESSGEEDDLEDGFSELETPDYSTKKQKIGRAETVDGLIPDPELSGDEGDVEDTLPHELEFSETESDPMEKKKSSTRWPTSELFEAIVSAPGLSVHKVLDKWLEAGKEFSRDEILQATLNLRKRRMYGRALQLSEWLEANEQIDFDEKYYASRLDLIAKTRGLHKAESYLQMVPLSFKGELIYRTLLANCVVANNAKKAEEVFNKMKDLEFPITAFACNQLLLLYKRFDKKKIADVLLLMEKENVKPSLFTYKLLIDTKGLSHDITGMDEIVQTMKAEGHEPDTGTKFILAKHYVSGGLTEKAEAVLKEMEGDNLKENRWACRFLLPLYAELRKADDVGRVWKVCESKPRLEECTAAILAWGKLNKVEEAEAVFDRMLKVTKKLPARCYTALLKVYSDHKMLQKGKDLVKIMGDTGCVIGRFTWDALIKLYVEAGEVEKADSILQKACQQNQLKPLYISFMTVMEQYSKRGDVHNCEKLFHRMRQAGYVARLGQFQSLVQAYINAKAPAYGMRERMKADNIFPNKHLAAQLVQVDAFRRTAVSDLLD